ncbi:hypothetical protein D3C85_1547540 [compost metagenome]
MAGDVELSIGTRYDWLQLVIEQVSGAGLGNLADGRQIRPVFWLATEPMLHHHMCFGRTVVINQ